MERRYWLLVVVLAVLGIGTELLLWVTRERPDAQMFSGPPRSDYTLTDVRSPIGGTDAATTARFS